MGLEQLARGGFTAAEVRGYVGSGGGGEFECDESSIKARGDEAMAAGFEEGGDFEFGCFVG